MGTDDMESGSGWKRPGNPVQRSVDRNAFPPSNQLYIANLLFDLTEQDLSDNMSRFGPIQRVKILYDGSGLSRGCVPCSLSLSTCPEPLDKSVPHHRNSKAGGYSFL